MEPSQALIDAIRQSIFEHEFDNYDDKDDLRSKVNEMVVLPKDDKGEWCPASLAIVYLELGVGEQGWANNCLDYWQTVDERVRAKGFPVYSMFINNAVTAYFPGE